jgi:hypothetical protein
MRINEHIVGIGDIILCLSLCKLWQELPETFFGSLSHYTKHFCYEISPFSVVKLLVFLWWIRIRRYTQFRLQNKIQNFPIRAKA